MRVSKKKIMTERSHKYWIDVGGEYRTAVYIQYATLCKELINATFMACGIISEGR